MFQIMYFLTFENCHVNFELLERFIEIDKTKVVSRPASLHNTNWPNFNCHIKANNVCKSAI